LVVAAVAAIGAIALTRNDERWDTPSDQLVSLGFMLNAVDGSRPPAWTAAVETEGTGNETVFSLTVRDESGLEQAHGEVRRGGTRAPRVPSNAEVEGMPCRVCAASIWTTPEGGKGFEVAVDQTAAVVFADGMSASSLDEWLARLVRLLDG
jgi:hypothetical protein